MFLLSLCEPFFLRLNSSRDILLKMPFLERKDIGLDETTPLLEWGIINSLEIVRLLNFIREQFGVDIPAGKIVTEPFTSISSIAKLVLVSMPAQSA